MRVVAGMYKGKRLNAPEGMGTRPTIDRVKESLFSSLYSELGGFDDIYALDLFAGSGALGIEALSRGASFCMFCDHDKHAVKIIQDNLKNIGADASSARVALTDVCLKQIPAARRPYDLVLLDPPYAYSPKDVLNLIQGLETRNCLAEEVLITYEHDTNTNIAMYLDEIASPFGIVSHKKFGNTTVDILGRQA